MAREKAVSFRILHPEPWDFFRCRTASPEIQCAAEFSSSKPARHLETLLQNLEPRVHHPRVEPTAPFRVSWSLPWKNSERLSKFLKKDFPELSRQVQSGLQAYGSDDSWKLGGPAGLSYAWKRKTQIMGVLNITPDSFSDGGLHLDLSAAVARALQMQEEGADWIDVGGESSRPGARAVSAQEEKKRVLPVLKACAKALRIPLSVDTYKAEVARAAVGEGARMVNDIGALGLDPRMGKTLAALKVPVILMHMRGKPRTMQKKPVYGDVVGEILAFFRERMGYARQCGIRENRLLLDPGFGFGKTPWHNMELTRRLWEFKVLGRPLVYGPSRKSTLGVLLGGAAPEKRVEATGAAVAAGILKGADWVRVHDVQSMVPVVKITDALRHDRGLKAP